MELGISLKYSGWREIEKTTLKILKKSLKFKKI